MWDKASDSVIDSMITRVIDELFLSQKEIERKWLTNRELETLETIRTFNDNSVNHRGK